VQVAGSEGLKWSPGSWLVRVALTDYHPVIQSTWATHRKEGYVAMGGSADFGQCARVRYLVWVCCGSL